MVVDSRRNTSPRDSQEGEEEEEEEAIVARKPLAHRGRNEEEGVGCVKRLKAPSIDVDRADRGLSRGLLRHFT